MTYSASNDHRILKEIYLKSLEVHTLNVKTDAAKILVETIVINYCTYYDFCCISLYKKDEFINTPSEINEK